MKTHVPRQKKSSQNLTPLPPDPNDSPELEKNINRLPPRPLTLARVRGIYEHLARVNGTLRKLEREHSRATYELSCIWFDLHEFFSRVELKQPKRR